MGHRIIGKCTLGRQFIAGVVLGLTLTGCLADDAVKTQTPFNYNEVAWAARSGGNTIVGTGKMIPEGGSKTYLCDYVWLSPDSAYRRELQTILFGNTEGAVLSRRVTPRRVMFQEYGEAATLREERCDKNGEFKFRRIPDGVWYIVSDLGPFSDTYTVMKRIEVRGSTTLTVTLP